MLFELKHLHTHPELVCCWRLWPRLQVEEPKEQEYGTADSWELGPNRPTVMPGAPGKPRWPSRAWEAPGPAWSFSLSRSFSAEKERRDTGERKNWAGREEARAEKRGEDSEKGEDDQPSEEEDDLGQFCPKRAQYFFSQDRGRDLKKRQVIMSRCINTRTPTRPDKPHDDADGAFTVLEKALVAPILWPVPVAAAMSIAKVSETGGKQIYMPPTQT